MKKTPEQLTDKLQQMNNLLEEYINKGNTSSDLEQKNLYLKKASKLKKNINSFKAIYFNRLTPDARKELKKDKPKITIPYPSISSRMEAIEQRARELIRKASTEEEIRSIKERLYYTRIRATYGT